MIVAAPCLKGGSQRSPSVAACFQNSPHSSPTDATPTEEPMATALGLERRSVYTGQPSPALEDWEGELACLGVPSLLRACWGWGLGYWGRVRRGHTLDEGPGAVLVPGHDSPWR